MKLHWDLCIIDSFYESFCLTLVYSACKVMLNVRGKSHERDPPHPHPTQAPIFFYSQTGICSPVSAPDWNSSTTFKAVQKFQSDKWLYVIILITVSKAVELSNTPMKYYRHIDRKWAAQKDASTCQKCYLLNKMLLLIRDTCSYNHTAGSNQAVQHAVEKCLWKCIQVYLHF